MKSLNALHLDDLDLHACSNNPLMAQKRTRTQVGQIQKLVTDADEELGKTLVPYFAMLQVFFMLAFVVYFVVALVALVLDAEAMDAQCAAQSWVWLYVLLVLVVPTIVGFVMGLVESTSRMVTSDAPVLRVLDMLLAIPSPLVMVVLGVIGLALWGGMEDECADFYWANFGMVLLVFYVQVCLMCFSALFGLLALCGMGIGLVNSVSKRYTQFPENGIKDV